LAYIIVRYAFSAAGERIVTNALIAYRNRVAGGGAPAAVPSDGLRRGKKSCER
jgi:hypothetical protein